MSAVTSKRQRIWNRALVALIFLLVIIYLLPLYWISSTAFKPRSLATTVPPTVVFQPEITPFVMLLCLAGLSAIPQHLYEAAAIDRASKWYTFTRITLPLVSPLLLIAIIFRTMEAFKTFDLAFIMTSMDTTELIAIRLYKMAFQEWQTGKSCALAYIVLIMVLAITNIYVKYLNQAKAR